MNKIIIYLLICIFMISSVFSQLTIEYPNTDYIFNNQNMTLNFKAYDDSGFIQKYNNIDCVFDLYNYDGSLIISNYTMLESDVTFYVYLNKTDFIDKQKVYYSIYCNSTTEGGFLNKDMIIESYPYYSDKNYNAMWSLIIFSIILGFLLIYILKTLNDKQHYWFKMFLFGIITLIPFFIFLVIQSVVSKESFTKNIISQNLWIFNIFEILMIITTTYVVIMLLKFLIYDMLMKGRSRPK